VQGSAENHSDRRPRPGKYWLAGQAGFTLLEVMIALAIVSVALVALLALGNRTVATNDRLQKLTQATLLAQSKLTELETGAIDLSTGLSDSQGGFEAPYNDYTWRTRFLPTPVDGVQEVQVTVIWGAENRNESVELTSFLFR
jgi:general secretion pathway protein I